MEVIVAYIIFCLATALSLLYHIYIPLIQRIRVENPETLIVSSKANRIIALSTLTLGSVLFAPVLFFPAIFKGPAERYTEALHASLLD